MPKPVQWRSAKLSICAMEKLSTLAFCFLFKLALVSGISSSAKIHVWDNVLSATSRSQIHQVAADQGLGHTLMVRANKPSSLLELALEGILQELNDTSPYVEYWCRQEWRHIEAHADVDEYRAKIQPGDFRYPTNGHVLYLQVGPQVRGPTCLFPACKSGGDLAHQSDLKVLTVPAVSGRLLRFPGHWLHAVPRPTDIWLLPFVKGSPDFSSEFERSVVLFNTWNEEPPMQVEPLLDASCQEDGTNLVKPLGEWNDIETIDSEPSLSFSDRTKIWLLGDLKRRNFTMRTAPVYSNGEVLRDALNQASQPKSTPLSQSAVEG